jgi:hypothetical protein
MVKIIIQMYKNEWKAIIYGVKICLDRKIQDRSCK